MQDLAQREMPMASKGFILSDVRNVMVGPDVVFAPLILVLPEDAPVRNQIASSLADCVARGLSFAQVERYLECLAGDEESC